MKILKRTEFGDPVLRMKAQTIASEEIASEEIQELITDMRHTLLEKKLGVGLAAPQVGKPLALAVIAIRPSAYRPKSELFDLVLINPEIISVTGDKSPMWEGCISCGPGKAAIMAKVPRYGSVKVRFYDEKGRRHEQTFKGLTAQVVQHETDHLNGTLFVDKVKDTKTYMSFGEYLKMVKRKSKDKKEAK